MQTAAKFDISTLAWIKGEIDETIQTARVALEAFADAHDQVAELDRCREALRQVRAVLQIVDISGAARFANEIEASVQALAEGKSSPSESVLEGIMRAILQLPDYLDMLQNGGADSLFHLLPLLNDLRAGRGERLLSESALFQPNLDVASPDRDRAAGDVRAIAAKARPHFQTALAHILRGHEVGASLDTLGKVVDAVDRLAAGAALQQSLWVAAAFIESLHAGTAPPGKESVQLLGKVEQLIKQLVQSGEEQLNAESVRALTKVLLFHVGKAVPRGPKATEVADAFRLDELLPANDGSALMRGLNTHVKKTVSADVMEELSGIKDILDVFVRGQRSDVSNLAPVAERMARLGETLSMLGQEQLAAGLGEQAETVQHIVAGELDPADDVLMGIAGAMLVVESTLKDWGTAGPIERADDVAGQVANDDMSPQAEAEHLRVVRQVMKEAKDDLISIRELVNLYLEQPGNKERLADLPVLFSRIYGSLTLLSYTRVAQVVHACAVFVQREIIEGSDTPTAERMDRFADAVMSVEYYLEAFVESRVHPASVLDVAERALAELGWSVDDVPEVEVEHVEIIAPAADAPAAGQMAPPAPMKEAATAPHAEPVAEEFDDEIAQVFLEEAQEELAKIHDLLPRWQSNPNDVASLQDYRRCFHTLKGSGRLVGAVELGEFAWAVEDMLNRVLDGSVTPAPVMFDFLLRAEGVLPALVERFSHGTAVPHDVTMLQQAANEISRGGTPDLGASGAVDEPEQQAAVEVPAPAIVIDPELLEVYSNEAAEHLRTIEAFSQSVDRGDVSRVSEPLVRAVHTLKGSSRIAGVADVADVSAALERYTRALQAAGEPITAEGNAALNEAVALGRGMLEHLRNPVRPMPDGSAVVERAEALYASVKHLEDALSPEIGLSLYGLSDEEDDAAVQGAAEPDEAEPVTGAYDFMAPEDGLLSAVEESTTGGEVAVGAIHADDLLPAGAADEDYLSELAWLNDLVTAEPGMGDDMLTSPGAQAVKPVEADKAVEADGAFETLEAFEGFESVESIQPFEPSEPFDAVDLVETFEPVEAVEPEPIQPSEPIHPSEPFEAVEAVELVEAFEPVEPAELAELAEGVDAFDAIELVEAADAPVSLEWPAHGAAEENAKESEALSELPLGDTTSLSWQVTPTDDQDSELTDLFLEEGSEIIDASEETLQAWMARPDRRDLMEGLQRQLHTLKGSARMAGVTAVGDLAHALESIFEALVEQRLSASIPLQDAVQRAHDRLARMLDSVRLRASAERADDLIAELHAVSVERDTGAPVAAPEQSAPIEYDQELLDLFLEEGSELLDQSEETLQALIAAPHDKSRIVALQRQLHTLKGSARMAAANAIGNLAHGLESTFEALAEGRLETSKSLFDLLQAAHDRLGTQLDQVRRLVVVDEAGDLIERLQALGRADAPAGDAAGTNDELPAVQPPAAPMLPGANLAQAADAMRRALGAWRQNPGESALHEQTASAVTAIQDASSTSQIVNLAALSATTGYLLSEVHDGHVLVSDELFGLLDLVYERISILVEQHQHGTPLRAVQDLIDSMKELVARHGESAGVAAPGERGTESEDDAANRRRGSRIQHEMVRVRRDLMDNLVNFAGEVSIYRSRIEQQINAMHGNLGELDSTVERLHEQLRKFDIETEAQIASRYHDAVEVADAHEEFDPLEFDRFTTMQQLSRSMMESLGDIRSLEDLMLGFTRESETLLLQQARVNTELQETLMQTRMVQLVENAPRLRRIVRQTAAELGREANLGFPVGAHVEMDRRVVERLIAPLEHMLRNAVAHGIEAPAERTAAGKPAAGSITISMSKEGSEVVLRVADDGRGIDVAGVRAKAIERGLMEPNAKLSDREVMMFVCEPGFSTAAALTQIAGRGVGMDVVSNAIRELGGSLEIESEFGRGTRFVIRLPATLSVSRALLVNVGEETFAVPLLSIKGIERIPHTELARLLASEQPTFEWLGQEFRLLPLGPILGVASTLVGESSMRPLLLTQSGDHRVALAVDRIIGSREVVIKSLGPQLSTLGSLSGATILSDGSVALVLELPAIIRRGMAKRQVIEEATHAEPAEAVGRNPTVMVVDDSITVRAVTKRLLQRHQMTAVAAKDGVDALAVLEETIPDVILLDIEMPRMDGFELAAHIRNSERLRHIPIIMITSRTGDKHRQRAMDVGVNLYMGKPYSENELLENIGQLVGRSV